MKDSFILGLIAFIVSFISFIIFFFVGSIAVAFGYLTSEGYYITLALFIIFSVLGLIGSTIGNKKWALITIICGVLLIITHILFGSLPGALYIISGLIEYKKYKERRKEKIFLPPPPI